MEFFYPLLLLLVPFSLAFCIWNIRRQYFAIKEIQGSVHPSKYDKLTQLITKRENGDVSLIRFWIYQIFSCLAFLSIVVTLAYPYKAGDAEFQTKQTSVYLVFDGSWSMDAYDATNNEGYSFVPRYRFEEARFHSIELNKRMEDVSFGIFTFAGTAVQHSHPLNDKDWIHKIIFDQMGSHNTFYSGTNYDAVFSELISSSKYLGEGFQVVLYSDGDASEEEKAKALERIKTFSRLKIPIHVVALGKPDGAEIELVFNLLDQVDSKDEVSGDAAGKIYQATSTVSVQKRKSIPDFAFLKSIADSTRGEFVQTSLGTSGIEEIITAIESGKDKEQILLWEAGSKQSLGYIFFILPFLFFLYDFLWIRKAVKLGN